MLEPYASSDCGENPTQASLEIINGRGLKVKQQIQTAPVYSRCSYWIAQDIYVWYFLIFIVLIFLGITFPQFSQCTKIILIKHDLCMGKITASVESFKCRTMKDWKTH